MGNIIEIAIRIGFIQIDGGWDDLMVKAQYCRNGLDASCCP